MFEKHSIKHKKIIKKKNKNTPEYVNINLIEIETDKTTEIFKYFRSENSKKYAIRLSTFFAWKLFSACTAHRSNKMSSKTHSFEIR